MNVFQNKISSCWLIPSNRVSPFSNKTEMYKRVIATKSILIEKQSHISTIRVLDGIFQSMHSSKSNDDDPFVQSITNDDVLANNIIRRKH